MSAPTTSPAQLHKAMISMCLAIDQLRDTISRISYVDRGDSGLQRCADLLNDAHKHMVFEDEEQQIKVADKV